MTPIRNLLLDLSLVGAYAFAGYAIVATALRLRRRDEPRGPKLMVLAAADVLLLTLIAAYGSETIDVFRSGGRGGYPDEPAVVIALAFVAAMVTAVAVADTLLTRVPALVGYWQGEPNPWPAAVTAAVVLFLAAGATVVVVERVQVDPRPVTELAAPAAPAPSRPGVLDAAYPLHAGPLDVAMDGPRTGYLTTHPDAIYRFELPESPDGTITLAPVATGLAFPRGLALLDGRLYATVIGPVPCPDPAEPNCRPDLTPAELELETIAGSDAGILAFDVGSDGSLGPAEQIVSGLPVDAFDHAVNALEAGPDGRLYASVGNLSDLALFPELQARIDHPRRDLLGTVISFRPDGSDLQVHARGLRNLYDLAFTPDGELFTVDNDGEALNSLRREEILRIEAGDHFGFPTDGTFEPYTVRTAGPTWIFDGVGSSGVAWSTDLAGGRGLVVGALGSISFVEFGTREGAAGLLVGSRGSVRKLLDVDGYATTVDVLPDGRLLVGVFNPWAPESNALLVVSVVAE